MKATKTKTIKTTPHLIDLSAVMQPIAGKPSGKNLLSMWQLEATDIQDYIAEAYAAESTVHARGGATLLPCLVAKAVMRQPSTRTGGSFTTAMRKLGGSAELISGMSSSSEAKGESLADSWVAFATQADMLGIRTAEDDGPARAAYYISQAVKSGQLWQTVPVINLGDGRNEHPTQALGDLFTIHKKFKTFEGLTITVVGDQARYRAHHSLMIGAAKLGMKIISVESPAAPVPLELVRQLGDSLTLVRDLDQAMRSADILYLGRNPDEYTGDDEAEKNRSQQLTLDFIDWTVNFDRIQQMKPSSIIMHPRPRLGELSPDVDGDPRMKDVEQMSNMIPMRMAIIARHFGKPLVKS